MYLYWADLDGFNVLVFGKPLKKIGCRIEPIPDGRYPPAAYEQLRLLFVEGGSSGMLVNALRVINSESKIKFSGLDGGACFGLKRI